VGVAAAATLCVGCTQFSVRRAALVPHQQPTLRSGQGMGVNKHEVSLGTPTLASLTSPKEVDGANAGVVLPRWEFNGAWRVQASPNFDIGLVVDWGLDKGSRSVDDDQPDPDNGDVRGGGFSFGYSFVASEALRIGLTADLLFYSIPYVEYRTCVSGCVVDFTDVKHDRETVPVFSIGITPSWRMSPNWAVFGGANLRNHPTIEKGDVELLVEVFDDEEVEPGPGNIVAAAGVEFTMGNGLRMMAYIFQPVYADPVQYGPTIGVNFTIPIGHFQTQPTLVPAPVPPGSFGAPSASAR